MELIYEVSIAVDPEVAEDYAAWLKGHVLDVLDNPGFDSATIHRADAPDGDTRRHFVVHYAVRDRAALDAYFASDGPRGAAAMRAEGTSRFGERFSATRRILERIP